MGVAEGGYMSLEGVRILSYGGGRAATCMLNEA